MTRSDLFELVYQFHPRAVYPGSPGYEDTVEHRRLVTAARRAVAEYPEWKAMIRRLGARYPLTDESLHVLAGWLDSAYSGHVEVPGSTLGFHVSFLGPYYGVHRTGSPGEEPAASDLAREIEATYGGYEPIPPGIGEEIVPEVALDCRGFGEATIYDCLLSTAWKRSSAPARVVGSRPASAAPGDEGPVWVHGGLACPHCGRVAPDAVPGAPPGFMVLCSHTGDSLVMWVEPSRVSPDIRPSGEDPEGDG